MSQITKALLFAAGGHSGQTDKGGKDYILHPLRMLRDEDSEELAAVKILHDVIEDTGYELVDLVCEGFYEDTVEAVDAITRRKGEPYISYLGRVKDNPLALEAKLCDIEDNINTLRLPELTERDLERVAKYHDAYKVLRAFKASKE